MPTYKLRNFGKYGVITDIPAYDLPNEAWVNCNNIRFVANRFEKMGGYSPILNPSIDSNPIVLFTQEPESNNILYATKNNIVRVQATQTQNINPLTDPTKPEDPVSNPPKPFNATNESPWDYTVLSNVVVFNNQNDNPVAWVRPSVGAGADLKLVQLTDPTTGGKQGSNWGVPKGDPASVGVGVKLDWKANRIRSYKNYLIALNMKEQALDTVTGQPASDIISYPQRVRWSDVAYVNALPPNWYEDKSDSDGGFNDLADCYGSIVDGRAMRDFFIIYTNRETYIMKYVGGDFVFDFQKLFPDSGVLNANCIVEFEGGNHFVVSEEDILIHDGSTRQSIATDVVKERVLDDITSVNYQATKVFSYPTRKEIWVCYTTLSNQVGTDENYSCNKAAVWNWKTGAWSFTDLPDIHWIEQVGLPNDDIRAWSNPDSVKLATPTDLVLDSPIDGLPVGKSFRLDCIYKVGEGITPGITKLNWTFTEVKDSAGAIVQPADYPQYVSKTQDTTDQSIDLHSLKEGSVTIRVELDGTPSISDSYTINLLPATTEVDDRMQASDPSYNSASQPTPRPDQYPDPANQWEQDVASGGPNIHNTELWEKKGYSFSARTLLAASEDHSFYAMDSGKLVERFQGIGKAYTSTPVVAEISKYAISMQDAEENLAYHKTWRTLYPLASGQGTLRFSIGGSNDPYVQPVTDETRDYKIGTDYKIDCFTNYRYLSFIIRDENEGEWSMSGMDIDYFLGGSR